MENTAFQFLCRASTYYIIESRQMSFSIPLLTTGGKPTVEVVWQINRQMGLDFFHSIEPDSPFQHWMLVFYSTTLKPSVQRWSIQYASQYQAFFLIFKGSLGSFHKSYF